MEKKSLSEITFQRPLSPSFPPPVFFTEQYLGNYPLVAKMDSLYDWWNRTFRGSMTKPGYTTDQQPRILDGTDLKALAKYMKSDSCRNVFLMVSSLITPRF